LHSFLAWGHTFAFRAWEAWGLFVGEAWGGGMGSHLRFSLGMEPEAHLRFSLGMEPEAWGHTFAFRSSSGPLYVL